MLFIPPAVQAPAPQTLPPLSFQGFQAGMPVPEAESFIRSSSGTLSCKTTLDWRMRDCTGRLRLAGSASAFEVLVSSVRDSSAVIVLSAKGVDRVATPWITELTERFGRPDYKQQSGQATWQWVRSGRMLRVIERKTAGQWETSVTLTHGPLLDGLGETQRQRP